MLLAFVTGWTPELLALPCSYPAATEARTAFYFAPLFSSCAAPLAFACMQKIIFLASPSSWHSLQIAPDPCGRSILSRTRLSVMPCWPMVSRSNCKTFQAQQCFLSLSTRHLKHARAQLTPTGRMVSSTHTA